MRAKNGNGKGQLPLFARPEENPALGDDVDFNNHTKPLGWKNRLIAGDSLLVMNSLLEKEGLGGQVQMVYIDPPYGIRYGSNFQPFGNKRDVTDSSDDDHPWCNEPWSRLGLHGLKSGCFSRKPAVSARKRVGLASPLAVDFGLAGLPPFENHVAILGFLTQWLLRPRLPGKIEKWSSLPADSALTKALMGNDTESGYICVFPWLFEGPECSRVGPLSRFQAQNSPGSPLVSDGG